MLAYIARRVLYMIPTLFGMSLISFAIIQLPPGDYLTSLMATMTDSGQTVDPAQIARLREIYGLGDPFYVQYAKWIWGILSRGDFGWSFEWNQPVAGLIWSRMGSTLAISLLSLVFVWAISLPIGIYSAVRQYSLGDYVATMLGFIGLAIPNFLLALILMYLGFRYLGLSVGGLFSADFAQAPWSLAKAWDLTKHLPMPACVLALAGTAQLIRIMRANLLDELRKPYVITARAKGIPEHRVILKYPVRAALNPFASSIAYVFPYLVSGSIIVSLVLGLPTVGPLLLQALVAQDMFLAGTIVLLLGIMTVIGTLVSDLMLMWIEPRLRLTGRG